MRVITSEAVDTGTPLSSPFQRIRHIMMILLCLLKGIFGGLEFASVGRFFDWQFPLISVRVAHSECTSPNIFCNSLNFESILGNL